MVAESQTVSPVGLPTIAPIIAGHNAHLHVVAGMRDWEGKTSRVYQCQLTTAEPEFMRGYFGPPRWEPKAPVVGPTLVRSVAGEVRVYDHDLSRNTMAPAWSFLLTAGQWAYLPHGSFRIMKMSHEPAECIVVTTRPADGQSDAHTRRFRGEIPWALPSKAEGGEYVYDVGPSLGEGIRYTTRYSLQKSVAYDTIDITSGPYSDTIVIPVYGHIPALVLN